MISIHILVVTSGPRLGDIEAAVVAALTTPQFAVVSGGIACVIGVWRGARRFPELAHHVSARDRRDADRPSVGPWLESGHGSDRTTAALPHRVIVIGGGFAGLYAARSLGIDPEVRLTLVDRRNFHLFQPLLYQVATGALSPGDIAQPLRSVLRKQRNTTVILGEAVGLDVDRREVLLADGGPIAVRHAGRRDGRPPHLLRPSRVGARSRPGLKTIEDATEIRRRILIAFEAAEREADPDRRRAWMTFVLVGGGPTGVELAGALGEIAHDTLRRDFRVDPARARRRSSWSRRWTGSCRPIRPTGRRRRSASSSGSGVEVRTRTRVVHIDEDVRRGSSGRTGATETIPTRTVLWAAGVLASRFGAHGRRGDRRTDRPLRAGHRRARPDDPRPPRDLRRRRRRGPAVEAGPGRRPGVAQGAIQGGEYAAKVIRRRILGRPHDPFRYSDHGDVAVIGRLAGRHQHQLARAVRAAGRLHRPGRCGSASTSST